MIYIDTAKADEPPPRKRSRRSSAISADAGITLMCRQLNNTDMDGYVVQNGAGGDPPANDLAYDPAAFSCVFGEEEEEEEEEEESLIDLADDNSS